METTSLSSPRDSRLLYKLYAQASVRLAFHPFETYADSPEEESMYESERTLIPDSDLAYSLQWRSNGSYCIHQFPSQISRSPVFLSLSTRKRI